MVAHVKTDGVMRGVLRKLDDHTILTIKSTPGIRSAEPQNRPPAWSRGRSRGTKTALNNSEITASTSVRTLISRASAYLGMSSCAAEQRLSSGACRFLWTGRATSAVMLAYAASFHPARYRLGRECTERSSLGDAVFRSRNGPFVLPPMAGVDIPGHSWHVRGWGLSRCSALTAIASRAHAQAASRHAESVQAPVPGWRGCSGTQRSEPIHQQGTRGEM